MVLNIRDFKKYFLRNILLLAAALVLIAISRHHTIDDSISLIKMGANIHPERTEATGTDDFSQPVARINAPIKDSERFQRPSKQKAFNLKFNFGGGESDYQKPPFIPKGYPEKYDTSEDVIQAYYSIIKDASNMSGYHGGCGTIGLSKIPYPFAYELLTTSTKKSLSFESFEKSFAGIGHITLLKLLPVYKPADTPDSIKYHMVEIEVITGAPCEENAKKPEPSLFAYYYGIITTENEPGVGWKIKAVDYVPEDFLCAPMHHWYWESQAVTGIIYKNWYNMIDKIDRTDIKDSIINIYASGPKGSYRFEFVRLTNGEDLLLHEYIKENNQWKETNFIKPDHQFYKFSIQNPRLQNN